MSAESLTIALPRIQSMLTGVAYFQAPPTGETLTAVYEDGSRESVKSSRETMILLRAIANCVAADKALPEFDAFTLVSEVQPAR